MFESNPNWKNLYNIGGVSALVFVVYSLITMILLVIIGGQPETVIETYDLLNENQIVGLLRLDVLTLLIMPFYYPLFLCIYVALKKTDISYITLSTVLAFVGVTLFLATPSAFSLVSLSDKYAAATNAAYKDQLLAAGEAMLASDMWHSSGAMIGGFLVLIAALVVSILMLKSGNFGKGTAYMGILTHGLDLLHIVFMFIFPKVGVFLMAIAGPLYLVWFPLLARDFFRLGRVAVKPLEN
jgi:hypothetical protein